MKLSSTYETCITNYAWETIWAGMIHWNELLTMTVKQFLDAVLKKLFWCFCHCQDLFLSIKRLFFLQATPPHFCFLMDLSLMWMPVSERSTIRAISLGLKLGSATSSYLFRVRAVTTLISFKAKFWPMQFLEKTSKRWDEMQEASILHFQFTGGGESRESLVDKPRPSWEGNESVWWPFGNILWEKTQGIKDLQWDKTKSYQWSDNSVVVDLVVVLGYCNAALLMWNWLYKQRLITDIRVFPHSCIPMKPKYTCSNKTAWKTQRSSLRSQRMKEW